jgi:DNA modification methylase
MSLNKRKPGRPANGHANGATALRVQRIPVSRLKPAVYNPRKDLQPGDVEYEKLKRSIERFGFVEPLVWNERSGNLVGGHQRLKILRSRGDTEVDVSVVDLDPQEEAALNVALNKIEGEWDIPKLADLLSSLDAEGFDATLTGFDLAELEGLLAPKSDGHGDPDAVPDVPAEPKSKRGEVYELGRHRLMCGDSTVEVDVARLMDGAKPALMVTDPPYGVDYDANWRNEADRANGKPYGARAIGKVSNDSEADWTAAWRLFSGSVVYCWHAGRHASTVQASLEAAGFRIRSQIIWAKTRLIISRGHYHWQHEPCWYAFREGCAAGWTGDRSQTTLWTIEHGKSESGHSTQKPFEAMARPIRNHKGDVYDPFGGSGTTLIAAEQLGRTCYMLEIDPGYCDVIRRRYADFVGKPEYAP